MTLDLPILEFRAAPARVRLGRYVHGALYLGASDGAVVFYDACVKRVRRVASNRASVTFVRRPGHKRVECQAAP